MGLERRGVRRGASCAQTSWSKGNTVTQDSAKAAGCASAGPAVKDRTIPEPPAAAAGMPSARLRGEDLLPIMYHELRALARARLAATQGGAGHTLQPTALVHEAYLRLTNGALANGWNGHGHFFGAAAEAMRQVLVDHSRAKGAIKRGGDRRRVDLDEHHGASESDASGRAGEHVMFMSEVIDHLDREDPTLATILKLRYFAGLNREEAAAAVDMPLRTFDRRWRYIVAMVRELEAKGQGTEASVDGWTARQH